MPEWRDLPPATSVSTRTNGDKPTCKSHRSDNPSFNTDEPRFVTVVFTPFASVRDHEAAELSSCHLPTGTVQTALALVGRSVQIGVSSASAAAAGIGRTMAASAPQIIRVRMDQISSCEPSSTTRLVGSLKNSIALSLFWFIQA